MTLKKIWVMLLLAGGAVQVSAQASQIGYSSSQLSASYALGLNQSGDRVLVQAAIQLPKALMSSFAGDSISYLRIGLSTLYVSDYSKSLYVFIADTLPSTVSGPYLYQQKVTNFTLGEWNTVELDSAFAITGDELYIGYKMVSNGTPIGCDGNLTSPDARGCWVYNGTDWQQYTLAGNICLLAYTAGAVSVPQYDVAVSSLAAPEYVYPGASFAVDAQISNNALKTLTSMDIRCMVNGVQQKDTTLSGLTFEFGQTMSVKIPGLVATREGLTSVSIEVLNLNGVGIDIHPTDNADTVQLKITRQCARRKVLLEHFTTRACVNCPAGHEAMEKAYSGLTDRIVWVSHHVGYNTDTYTITESNYLLNFYNKGGSTYAPAAMCNRTNLADIGATSLGTASPGPVFEITDADKLRNWMLTELSEWAPLSISVSSELNAETRQLTLTASGKIYQSLGTDEPYISFFLTEDSLQSTQSGYDGIFTHNHVIREVLGDDIFGEKLTMNADSTYSVTKTITLPAAWNADNMNVVAFVEKINTADVNEWKVFNADCTPLVSRAVIPDATLAVAYCSDNAMETTGIGAGRAATYGAAIHLTKDQLFLGGSHIYAVRIGSPSTQVENVELFITDTLGKIPAYTQKIADWQGDWQYVLLDKPFAVGTKDLYIGYTLTAAVNDSPIGYEVVSAANTDADYIAIDGSWTHISSTLGNYIVCVQPILYGGDYSLEIQRNVVLTGNGEIHATVGEPFASTLTVENYGVQTLHDLVLTYWIDDASVATVEYTGLSIPKYTAVKMALPNQTLSAEGFYTMYVKASEVNMGNNVNTATEELTLKCFDRLYERHLLIEQYTGQACTNCPDGAASIKTAIGENTDRIMVVAHHAGYATDHFTIDESLTYANQFYVAGAPMCVLNRTYQTDLSTSIAFHPSYLTANYLNTLLADSSVVSVHVGTEAVASDRVLRTVISGSCPASLENVRLFVFLLEDGQVASQAGLSGGQNYVHNNILRAVLSDVAGDEFVHSDGTFTKSYTYTIPETHISKINNTLENSLVIENMRLVAFVADYNASILSDNKVYNVGVRALNDPGSGIEHVWADGETLSDNAQCLQLYTSDGRLLRSVWLPQTNDLLEALPQGIYLVRKQTLDGEMYTKKYIIK